MYSEQKCSDTIFLIYFK